MSFTTPAREPEHIHWRMVIAIVAGTLALFGVAVVFEAVEARLVRRAEEPTWPRVPANTGDASVNLLQQYVYPLAQGTREARNRSRRSLDEFGWVDRRRGIIHVPIDRAIDDLVSSSKPAGGKP